MSENKNSNSNVKTAVAAVAGAAAVGLGYAIYSLFSSGNEERQYCSASGSKVRHPPPPNSSPKSANYDTHPNHLEKKRDLPICTICHCDLKGVVRVLECFHSFHVECVDQWFKTTDENGHLNKTCPICREKN
ncbi:hypothetical protein LSTR_LSTR003600 [Laodelphax striatellus]|uniref:RING-type domain-containing protein n=1 Tax=Laodelphax striatellus TaxID=195883 RepID=A0A482WLJ6_LAOST|nr:hypothetical protein LSTR_LSTR003600 [Laodelphax striatellus]